LLESSQIIAAAVAAGQLHVGGGVYDLDEGRVRIVV
jgi:carbonic anhydrase